ncbi:response regulator [Leucobacter sp. GX0328]
MSPEMISTLAGLVAIGAAILGGVFGMLHYLEKRLNQHFAGIDRRFEEVDRRFDDVDRRFEEVDRRFEEVDRRFDVVDRRFDEVDRRFDEVDRRIGLLEDGSSTMAGELTEVKIAIARFEGPAPRLISAR